MEIKVDKARAEDLPTVFSLLDEAAAWLRESGIRQWPERFSGVEDWRQDRIKSYLQSGGIWLLRIDGEPAGTFTTGGADPDFAPGWPEGPDNALYVYRMAVRRKFAGQDLGGYMLDWCSAQAAVQGYRWLRLDCSRTNQTLQAYHEQHGFKRVGTIVHTIPDGDNGQPYVRGSGALYQRFARTIDNPEEDAMSSRYDPEGIASIWMEASRMVNDMKSDAQPIDENAWNTALDQASRLLENQAREIKQGNGMYYRRLTGNFKDSQ